jgi:hypothetical protein
MGLEKIETISNRMMKLFSVISSQTERLQPSKFEMRDLPQSPEMELSLTAISEI